MLLEIVVENGTSAIGQEEGQNETAEDEGDDVGDDGDDDDDDDDDDDEDEDSESENDDEDDLDIGTDRAKVFAKADVIDRQSKSLIRPWIEEDDDVRTVPAVSSAQHLASLCFLDTCCRHVNHYCHHCHCFLLCHHHVF
jgi:hypothetical protein